ncbi:ABC transporter ATP-binding protein [Mesobacillus sp. AQ2]|nr:MULTISPECIES: ABC transporter ATP-binding protein [unclassified Mesobacillus]MCM3125528.1 ABC transporter ATP-binding protein [Mesobacillus sp. MER 33]MCM3234428.1 ABC transporter ATP-binding protein [Mesobacillus sp. MER 48]WHX42841.1 ABC transporter ATP-binding protein [Mesobacillus sp. AQ2]
MSVLEFENVTKTYGRKKALDELTFSIGENKITGLIGRNGAGKTTMLKIAAGFMRESSGVVRVFGENPFNNLSVSANMIMVDNDMNLPAALNLDELLETAASFYDNWDMKFARNLVEYFHLDLKQHHTGLSKGMKNTFNAILGLASRCPLTIFDEPTNGMDAGVRKDFYRALLKDYIANPRTIIISSHHLNEVEDILEDILLLKDGKQFLHMTVEDLREYAVVVSGKEEMLNDWLSGHEIFHRSSAGFGRSYAVIRNDLSDDQVTAAMKNDLEFSTISNEDLCLYLTSQEKGGIDDVFNKD